MHVIYRPICWIRGHYLKFSSTQCLRCGKPFIHIHLDMTNKETK